MDAPLRLTAGVLVWWVASKDPTARDIDPVPDVGVVVNETEIFWAGIGGGTWTSEWLRHSLMQGSLKVDDVAAV